MKQVSIIILLLLTLFSLVKNNDEYKFITKFIDMPLDHFSFTTNKTFKLKYLVNETFFTDNTKPIFFYCGNEGAIETFAQNTGFMFDLAQKIGGLIIFAEHRFYGETMPYGNDSYLSPKNLGYLSAQQALADYVYLIDDLQKQYVNSSSSNNNNNNNLIKLPVIAFGGSYGGMLAAWLRIKYPYSVLGAIASSAPVLYFPNLTSCGSFYKVTTDVIRSIGSENCAKTLSNSWNVIKNITENSDAGKVTVSKIFQLCKPINSTGDLTQLFGWLSGIYVNLVMVNYPYATNFLAPLPAHPVKKFCDQLNSINYTDNYGLIKAVATGLAVYTNYTGKVLCNDIKMTSSNLGETGWNFQSCTDMIMPFCSTDQDLFENSPWDFKVYSDECFKTFGVRPRNENIPILEFGGRNIETSSNIVFSNGLLDPWSTGGILKNISSKILSILIPSGAHHVDLRGANLLDTNDIKEARLFHEKEIKKWLDKFYYFNLPIQIYADKVKKNVTTNI